MITVFRVKSDKMWSEYARISADPTIISFY